MIFLRYFLMALLGLILQACGGGGGSSGATGGATGGATTTTATVTIPTMSLIVVDAAGNEVTDHSLSQARSLFLKVILKTAAGVVVPYSRVVQGPHTEKRTDLYHFPCAPP